MLTISAIPAFSDNYIWCLSDTNSDKALIVDPGQAQPVLDHLAANNLTLDTILVTHHHPDHVGGVKELVSRFPDCRVTGPADSPYKGSTNLVHPGDEVIWGEITFQVLGVPGHTLDHIAYFTDVEVQGRPVLFCGDTLFVCGCGRLFEGSPEQMRQSLQTLRACRVKPRFIAPTNIPSPISVSPEAGSLKTRDCGISSSSARPLVMREGPPSPRYWMTRNG